MQLLDRRKRGKRNRKVRDTAKKKTKTISGTVIINKDKRQEKCFGKKEAIKGGD